MIIEKVIGKEVTDLEIPDEFAENQVKSNSKKYRFKEGEEPEKIIEDSEDIIKDEQEDNAESENIESNELDEQEDNAESDIEIDS